MISRNKIILLNDSLRLISQIVNTPENLQNVMKEINLNNLKSKVIDIFKFKKIDFTKTSNGKN